MFYDYGKYEYFIPDYDSSTIDISNHTFEVGRGYELKGKRDLLNSKFSIYYNDHEIIKFNQDNHIIEARLNTSFKTLICQISRYGYTDIYFYDVSSQDKPKFYHKFNPGKDFCIWTSGDQTAELISEDLVLFSGISKETINSAISIMDLFVYSIPESKIIDTIMVSKIY